MVKVNNKNTRTTCVFLVFGLNIGKYGRRSGVFMINFEHISQFFLVFKSLTLKKQMLAG